MSDDSINRETKRVSRLVKGVEEAKKAELDGDYRTAYETLLNSIVPMDERDEYDWGTIYFNGTGVQKDYKKAFEYFCKSSAGGSISATSALGVMYYNGLYVEKNLDTAFQLTLLAAKHGDAQAQNNIGIMYLNGEGTEKSKEDALWWFEECANSGDETCQVWLGQEFYRGITFEKSYENAWKWLRRYDFNNGRFEALSAHLDQEKINLYSHANCLLGMMYLHGKGKRRDDQKAIKCLRYAAENGDEEAQFWLGFQYVRGLGVDIDIQEGDKWLKESAKNGFEDAVKLQQATQKREFLDAIWAKAKEEAEQDRRHHALAQMKSDLI